MASRDMTTIPGFQSFEPPSSRTAGFSASVEFTDVSLEVVSAVSGIPLVDLSIDYEPWLVRGEE